MEVLDDMLHVGELVWWAKHEDVVRFHLPHLIRDEKPGGAARSSSTDSDSAEAPSTVSNKSNSSVLASQSPKQKAAPFSERFPPLVLSRMLPSERKRMLSVLRGELASVSPVDFRSALRAALCPADIQEHILAAHAIAVDSSLEASAEQQQQEQEQRPGVEDGQPMRATLPKKLTAAHHHLGFTRHMHQVPAAADNYAVGSESDPAAPLAVVEPQQQQSLPPPKGCYTVRHYMVPESETPVEEMEEGAEYNITGEMESRPSSAMSSQSIHTNEGPTPPPRECYRVVLKDLIDVDMKQRIGVECSHKTVHFNDSHDTCVRSSSTADSGAITVLTSGRRSTGGSSTKKKSKLGGPLELNNILERMAEWERLGRLPWYHPDDPLPVCWCALLARDECEARELIVEEECLAAMRDIPFHGGNARSSMQRIHFYEDSISSTDSENWCHELHPALANGLKRIMFKEEIDRKFIADEEARDGEKFPSEVQYLHRVATVGATLRINFFLRGWIRQFRFRKEQERLRREHVQLQEEEARFWLSSGEMMTERCDMMRAMAESLEQMYRTSLEMTHLRLSVATSMLSVKYREQVERFETVFGAPMSRARLCGRTDVFSVFRGLILAERHERNQIREEQCAIRCSWPDMEECLSLSADEARARTIVEEHEAFYGGHLFGMVQRLITHYTLRDDEIYEAVERDLSIYAAWKKAFGFSGDGTAQLEFVALGLPPSAASPLAVKMAPEGTAVEE